MPIGDRMAIFAPGAAAALGGFAGFAASGSALGGALAAAAGAIAGAALARRPAREDRDRQAPEAAAPESPLRAGMGRMLLDRMPQAVLLVDRDGRVVFVNPQTRRFFGTLPAREFPVEGLRTPKLLEAIEAVLSGAEARAVEFTLSRRRELHFVAHVVPLDGEPAGDTELGVLVVVEDQTRAHRADRLHRDFVANASHELKTPLAAASAIIETLQGHARGDEEAQTRFLGMLGAQTERMKVLIEDLISLNRIEINERVHPKEPQPVARIAHEAAEALRPLAEAGGMRIVAPDPADLPLVAGHREELTQLVTNLVENALRYAKPSPEVRIRLVEDAEDRPGMVGIAVEDDGPGIAREHLPRLTERFYRVSVSRSRERGGTGLGLAIVKHILNRHRGELQITSTVGAGSCFTAWLPVTAEGEKPGRDKAARGNGRDTGRAAEARARVASTGPPDLVDTSPGG